MLSFLNNFITISINRIDISISFFLNKNFLVYFMQYTDEICFDFSMYRYTGYIFFFRKLINIVIEMLLINYFFPKFFKRLRKKILNLFYKSLLSWIQISISRSTEMDLVSLCGKPL